MSIAQSLLPEFDHEMANTRKTLERVPENKLDYKPDPKSMSMGVLASHIAEMAGWLPAMAQGPSLDIPEGFKPFLATSRKQLLDKFDENVAASRAALAAAWGIRRSCRIGRSVLPATRCSPCLGSRYTGA